MKITQISLFLENRSGRIREVCHVLGGADINILSLTVAETKDFGILRLVVDKPDAAVEVLKEHHFAAHKSDVVVVGVKHAPGGLAHVLDVLATAQINIEYMHALLNKTDDFAYMIFSFDNAEEAVKTLVKNKVPVITWENIKK